MTRIITILSGKGGVGKTTTVSNLGAALVNQGKNVIILDGNVTTPNLSLHLGIPFYPITLNDVMKNKFPADAAMYEHKSGLRIIPASLSSDSMEGLDVKKMEGVLLNLLGKADIILVDAAAGLGSEAKTAINVADELLIVTNPDLPSVTDALRAIKIAETHGTKVLGIVVNRRTGNKYEMSDDDIKQMLDSEIIVTIPESTAVPKSIHKKSPIVYSNPSHIVSKRYKELAEHVMGKRASKKTKAKNWVDRLLSWLI